MSFNRKKTIESVIEHANSGSLKRTLGFFDLFLMGIGAIVGTGIFTVTGIAAAELSGPAVTFSYLIAGLAAIFVALAYTEVASMIPTSGGSYAYTYVAVGELAAWVVGWMVLFYLLLASAAVASAWSGYFQEILSQTTGSSLPAFISKIPTDGGFINLPAVFISVIVTLLLIRGTSENAKINSMLVLVKAVAIVLFVIFALPHFSFENWFNHGSEIKSEATSSSSFMPFGIQGVFAGSAMLFFAYNGFDTLANAIEEAKNPEKDITKAILSALLACIVVYMIVAGLLVGIVPFDELKTASPLGYALGKIGNGKGAIIISTGAVLGMTSVILLQIYAYSRMVFVMARDGLLPSILTKINTKYHTPHIAIIIGGAIVSVVSGFCPLDVLASLVSMTAMFSFTVVSAVMLILRKKLPNAVRPFKCPAAFFVAPTAILLCGYLISTLIHEAGIYFFSLMAIGVVVYFAYAYIKSKTAKV